MVMATTPWAANDVAYFSSDAAVSPQPGASTTAGDFEAGEKSLGRKRVAWHWTSSLWKLAGLVVPLVFALSCPKTALAAITNARAVFITRLPSTERRRRDISRTS